MAEYITSRPCRAPDSPGRRVCPRHDADVQTRDRGAPAADTTPEHRALYRADPPIWPLPNVWLGASVEDQVRADERRASMETVAAAGWTTFVSYEPALGPVNWARLGIPELADRWWRERTRRAAFAP